MVDSGCVEHISREVDRFYFQNRNSVSFSAANGSPIVSIGSGTVRGLPNVKCLPKLSFDGLLSAAKIVDQSPHHHVVFSTDGVRVISDPNLLNHLQNTTIACGKRLGNLYFMMPEALAPHVAPSTKPRNRATIAHRRLCHMPYPLLKRLRDSKRFRGLQFSDAEWRSAQETLCPGCTKGKMTAAPRPRVSWTYVWDRASRKWIKTRAPKATRPLQRIHGDIHVYKFSDRSRNQYALILVDEFSLAEWVYPMKQKSQALHCFRRFLQDASRGAGLDALILPLGLNTPLQVDHLRTDNGGEFTSRDFLSFVLCSGIRPENSTPIESHAFLAERTVRSLEEAARCLLFESKLPFTFYSDALLYAAYTRLRVGRSSRGFRTPSELWTQHLGQRTPVDVSHLRTFGCPCVVHVPRHQRSPTGPTSVQGIFIGYSGFTRRYRIFVPSRNRIYERESVYFNENFEHEGVPRLVHEGEEKDEPTVVHVPLPLDKDTPTTPSDESPAPAPPQGPLQTPHQRQTQSPPALTPRRRRLLSDDHHDTEEVNFTDPHPGFILYGQRQRSRPDRLTYATTLASLCLQEGANLSKIFALAEDIPLPKTLKAALHPSNPHCKSWEIAFQKEKASLLKNHVFGHTVSIGKLRKRGIKILRTKTVFKVKCLGNGQIERFKVRIVACGNAQIKGMHYDETYAPTCRGTTIRLVLALAAIYGLELSGLDIETAFLSAKLDQPIYIYPPEGCEDLAPSGHAICLTQSLYGLRQSPRLFNHELRDHLKSLEFKQCLSDSCLYIRKRDLDICIIALVVDDMIVAHSGDIGALQKELEQKYDMKNLGTLSYCLGMSITRDKAKRAVYISQQGYIDKMLRKYGLDGENVKLHDTPADPSAKLTSAVSNSKADHYSPPVDSTKFRELVGSLLYAAICTRPDIAFAVQALSRHVTKPTQAHWAAGKRILRYLRRTIRLKLALGGHSDSISAFTDADWKGDNVQFIDSFKSTGGQAIFVGFGPVLWKTKLQTRRAKSSVESEYRAISRCSDNLLWIRNILHELGLPRKQSSLIFTDSRGAKNACFNPVQGNRLRHVELDIHSILERVEHKEVLPIWIPKELNIADIFTKPLGGSLFKRFRDILFGLQNVQLPTVQKLQSHTYKEEHYLRMQALLRNIYGDFQRT